MLPAAFRVEEIEQLVRMGRRGDPSRPPRVYAVYYACSGVVHEDDLCELKARSAGWEDGDYDFKTRMKNLEETTEAGQGRQRRAVPSPLAVHASLCVACWCLECLSA